jgi:hypothetical protein
MLASLVDESEDALCEQADLHHEEWRYLAEGNRSITFTHEPLQPSALQNYVLKLIKNEHRKNASEEPTIIESWLAKYLLGAQKLVKTHTDFSASLIKSCEAVRPQGRRKEPTDSEAYACVLEPSLLKVGRVIHQAYQFDLQSEAISIEIKLKCGFKSVSPFVGDDRDIKRRMGKYQIYQLAKYSDALEHGEHPPWGAFCKVSEYDPQDMLSHRREHILRALIALCRNPQNNFRLFKGNDVVFNCDSQSTLGSVLQAESFDERTLIAVLSEIFLTEDLTYRIAILQSLDLLDSEGAALVYAKLLAMVGSEIAAHDMISDFDRFEIDEGLLNRLHHVLINENLCVMDAAALCAIERQRRSCSDSIHSSSIHSEATQQGSYSSAPILSKLMQDLSTMRVCALTAPEEAASRRVSAHTWLDALTARECVVLLQAWLLALTAKDVSIVVALQPVSLLNERHTESFDVTANPQKASQAAEDGISIAVTSQTGDSAGIVSMECFAGSGCTAVSEAKAAETQMHLRTQWAYSVGVLDTDIKPVWKIRENNVKDSRVCTAAISVEKRLKD